MFKLDRLTRMELDRNNPVVDVYLRCEALSNRGLDAPLVQALWQAGDTSLLTQFEAATDAQIAALNTAA